MVEIEESGERQVFAHFCKRITLCAVFLLVTFFCKTGQTTEQAVIRIGAIFSTSGIAASHNGPMLEMTRLAVEHINASGGVNGRRLELIVIDNGSTSIGSAKAAREMAKLGVSAVIGGHWSSHSLAMAPILQEAAIPMISPASTNPEVTRKGDFIFRVCFLDSFQGRAMAHFVGQSMAATSAALVVNVDEQYSITLANYFADEFETKYGNIVANLQYRGDATDFAAIISQLIFVQPDVIYLPGYTRDSGLFIKQARNMGLSGIFLGGDAWDEIGELAGSAMDGSYQSAPWHPMVPNRQSRLLAALYQQKLGKELKNYSSPLAFDAVMVLQEAIRACDCTDGPGIKDALQQIEGFEGATGTISFNQNGDPDSKEVIILTYEGDRPVFVKALHSN